MAVTVAVAALAQVSEPIGGTTAGLFVAAAILVIVAYGLVWLGYLAVRYERREWMVRLFDPNSYPNGSLWEAIIEMAGASGGYPNASTGDRVGDPHVSNFQTIGRG